MTMLSAEQRTLQATVRDLAAREVRPRAEAVDRQRRYPAESLAALGEAGLMGLLVPLTYGGRGGGLGDLAVVEMALGEACASTAMCYLMHCCGVATIAAKATPDQGERWLRPAASGSAIATLAFSERGTGAHFYAPELRAEKRNGSSVISGRKSFVTSGSHAHLYPVLVNAPDGEGLDIYIIERGRGGVSFDGEWQGLGMAGNSSIAMVLDAVEVGEAELLGKHGDGQELVFNVVAPNFLVGLAAVNVGIAQAALDACIEHVRQRSYPSGQKLAEVPAIQSYIAEMSLAVASARELVLAAARAGEAGEATALLTIMQAKIGATETAKSVTETAMHVGGGQAYSGALSLERHWRDAHAGAVMAPTNDVLREWLGKTLVGLPLF